jgi:hypothetical protein
MPEEVPAGSAGRSVNCSYPSPSTSSIAEAVFPRGLGIDVGVDPYSSS